MEGGNPDQMETIMDYQRREFVLLSRMAQRGREMQKLRQQANEAVNSFDDTRKDSLRGAYLDPAVNSELVMLRQLLRDQDKEIEKLREENHNAPFHPTSIQGQKLLQKCAHLLEENSELGRQLGEEWLQTLRIQIAAERQKRVQLKRRIAEFEQEGEQIDAENERMQKRIAGLGQELKDARTEIDRMKKEIEEQGKPEPEVGAGSIATGLVPAASPPPQAEANTQPVTSDAVPAAVAPPEKKRKKEKKDKSAKHAKDAGQ
mmetsp:Transcript_15924/g.37560  ORF Transcript_15924/g.37560 Transcript_15924/m.37560 type:complete len:260 (+) Transcript_15924:83-862(+)